MSTKRLPKPVSWLVPAAGYRHSSELNDAGSWGDYWSSSLNTANSDNARNLNFDSDEHDCINNGEIGVEELADVLSEIFGVEIKNCYNVYMNMKRRKDDSRTYFLDELREKLNKRMKDSDLKGGKFKKR